MNRRPRWFRFTAHVAHGAALCVAGVRRAVFRDPDGAAVAFVAADRAFGHGLAELLLTDEERARAEASREAPLVCGVCGGSAWRADAERIGWVMAYGGLICARCLEDPEA